MLHKHDIGIKLSSNIICSVSNGISAKHDLQNPM